ncbi:MAG: aminofutalosine synthase MqnE, partial [Bacteroidota bacterium]
MSGQLNSLMQLPGLDSSMQSIAEKIENQIRITPEEGLMLFEKGSLATLGAMANFIRERKHGNYTYFNRNFHIEPTNVCVFSCKF